jgi:hypothetical protein
MAETVQKNFRMSQRAIKLLHSVARARGMTETDVVEFCVTKYALAIGQDVDRAKELLFQQICRAAANSPVLPSRVEEPSSLALNEELGREARQPLGSQPGQSAAGALATMVGEQWAGKRKKEKGKS